MPNQYYVYILTTKNNKIFYTGVTNNLARRTFEHKNKLIEGFTKKYNINKLVYFEISLDVKSAIEREKQVKDFRVEKKLELIKTENPQLVDLYQSIL